MVCKEVVNVFRRRFEKKMPLSKDYGKQHAQIPPFWSKKKGGVSRVVANINMNGKGNDFEKYMDNYMSKWSVVDDDYPEDGDMSEVWSV